MTDYQMKSRTIACDDSWDVIVAGGGPAGCAAAASAARQGAKTLLVEATGALGGMGTLGLVPAFCPFTDKERIIYGGMAETVLRQTMKQLPHVPRDMFDWVPIDPELLKRTYDGLVSVNGASVLFGTMLAGVETDKKGGVEALLVANKSGLTALSADVFVDCTGDADLAAWAGAEYDKGDENGEMQPATLCFILTNVDMYGFGHCGKLKDPSDAIIERIIASGKYPEIPDRHVCHCVIGPGAVGFNAGHVWNVDNTDPLSMSKGMMEGRKIAKAFRDACAEFFPQAFADSFLAATGSLLGIRETRRIHGDYTLTIEDFVNRRSFPDEICRNAYYIDVHHKKSEIGIEKQIHATAIHLKKGESHGIPYRCLTPKGLKNVLVAGRCISTDRAVQGSTRVMPVCLAMGEAAGMAAAMAAASDGDVRAVETARLRKALKEHNAYLPD